MMPPTIGLLGDVMLGRRVADALRERSPASVWSDELRRVAAGCDAVVANLECCISESGQRTALVPGKPFFFRGPPAAVASLRAIGVRAVSLANNHALDYGPDALSDTLALLGEAGIAAVGAGTGPAEARRGTVLEVAGAPVGIVAVADHPREYAASADGVGTAYADLCSGLPDWVTAEIARLRSEADFVIAFPHWGPNMTTSPARWQRARAAEMLEAGATLVAGHSAHLFHGVERHPGGLAAYDLGDALDDYAVDEARRNDLGLLALWRPRGDPELEFVGLRLRYTCTELARGADADWIANRLERACGRLGTRVERLDEQRLALAG
jgi:poly-gamma-glutamate synthesis protein (capsule biosynthesis protein)